MTVRRGPQGDLGGEAHRIEVGGAADAAIDALVSRESSVDLEAQRLREECGVAECRMNVERKVRGVERNVVVEECADALEVGSGERAIPAPEETVVHEQEVRVRVRGGADGAQR